MTPRLPNPEQNITPDESKRLAKDSFYEFAILAEQSKEFIDKGFEFIDAANLAQSEKLRSAFVVVTATLMEIQKNDTDDRVFESPALMAPLEEKVATYVVENLRKSLPKPALRYISSMTGPIDDIALSVDHVSIIIETLISSRPGPERVERRSLDIAELLSMKFAGMEAEEIGLKLSIPGSHVKGAVHRFAENVKRNKTQEEVGRTLRERLSAAGMLEVSHVLTKDEMDAMLPPRAPKNTNSGKRRPAHVAEVKKGVQGQQIHVEPRGSLRATPPSDHIPPEDLLPHETMAERRQRLVEEAKKLAK